MYQSHKRKYNTDNDPINRVEKYDTNKSQGHDAGVAKMKKDFDAGTKTLRLLVLAQQVAQWQEELDSVEEMNDNMKTELKKKIAEAKRKLSPELITENPQSLQNRVDTLRKKLGSDAWSLRAAYDQPVSSKILKELGIVPTMGKVIPRGQTGKDITR